jgi:serine/threonine protein kinase
MVHGDLKPANMLVEFDAERSAVLDLRIKDFQSSFKFDELSKVKATSPWYLPPEVLDYVD